MATPFAAASNSVTGSVRDASYIGAGLHLTMVLAGGGELLVEAPEASFVTVPQAGTALHLAWDAEDLIRLPVVSGEERS